MSNIFLVLLMFKAKDMAVALMLALRNARIDVQ